MSKKFIFRYTFYTDDIIHNISKNFDSFDSMINFLYLSKCHNPDFKNICDIRFDVIETDVFKPQIVPNLFDSESED